MSIRHTLALAGLAACAAAAAQTAGTDDEAARSFRHGRAHFMQAGSLREDSIENAWPALQRLERGAFRATVVYLHGCDGINALSVKAADLLAAAGYLVVLPDSFARRDKPRSCDALEHRGGLHREVLGWRHAEADRALRQARTLPAVDSRRIFLMGLSEGAIATATYVGEGVTGRVIEGWTCHAGWTEYQGLRAPPGEAVLSLVAQNDPWFAAPALQGDCGEFMGEPSPLRRSLVFRPPHPAASQHDLLWNTEARRALFDFLDAALAAKR